MSQIKTKFITNNAVTNAKAAQLPALSIKGNNTGSTANASDLTVSQVNVLLGDVLANGTVPFSADQSMGSHKLTNVTDPSGAQDAATKAYVDASVAALNPATAVFAASTANISGTYNNGVGGIGATFTTTATGTFTIDGTTPALGARILIKDQTSGFQNGIYTITTLGIVAVQTVFTRALDYNTASDMNNAGLIPVINGTVNALSSWQQVAVITTVGTDSLVFTEFTANPSLYLLKANNLNDVASASTSFNNISGLTTLGDLIYGGASGTRSRLAGNTTTTKNFLVQTGNGTVSAAPSWATIVASDIPSQLNAPMGINVAATAGTTLKLQALTDANAGNLQLISAANNHAANFYIANNGFFYLNVADNSNFALVQSNSGNVGIGGTGSPDANTSVTVSQSVDQVQLAVRGNATQTHNLQIWENSANTVLASVSQTGAITGSNLSGTNTGDQTITLTGDVTGSGTGSFAATIANLAVTNAKIANATIDLTTKVTGVLPIANGGTGSATTSQNFAFIGPTSGSGAPSFRALVSGDIPSLPYASSTLTSSHIFVGNGSNVATDVALSGDATLSNTGALTLATVNANTGSFGSSTAIPSFTVNAKGLITAASTNAVIAPAGTLTGTTLAANVVSSSLTSVGTITTGVWTGTAIAVANGGTGQTSYTDGQLLIGNSTGNTLTKTSLTAGSNITITPGSGSITIAASSSANPAYNVTSQSTTYSAVISDYVIASGSSFIITLPTAVAQSGKQIVIQHNGTSLSQKYTLNTTSAQTINGPGGAVGSGVYKLTTNGEKVILTSDGSNWQVTEHETDTGWVSAGNAVYYETFTVTSANATIGATYTNNGATFTVTKTIAAGTTLITQFFSGGPQSSGTLTKATGTGDATITFSSVSGNTSPVTGTTTNPVYFGTPTNNTFVWKRQSNFITIFIQFYQATAGAVAGSGDFIYDFSIPIPNVQIDQTYYPTFTGGTANTGQNNVASSIINIQPALTGALTNNSAYQALNGWAPFSATQFRVYGSNSATVVDGFPWGSTSAAGNTIQAWNYQLTFPVSDWQP